MAQDNPSNNIGSAAESLVAPPSVTDFRSQAQDALNSKKSTIITAAMSEAIPDVVHDAIGNFLGRVNYQPYASCQ